MSSNDRGSDEQTLRFRELALPYLDDAYTLAYYLMGSRTAAEDAVEQCYLRAFGLFSTWRGPSMQKWLLAIVREICEIKLAQSGRREPTDLTLDGGSTEQMLSQDQQTPSSSQEAATLRRLTRLLPVQLREAITLRELYDLSYHEIAKLTGVPLGTATLRVARARTQLLGKLKHGTVARTA